MNSINWKRGSIRLAVLLISIVAVYGIGGEAYITLFNRLPFLLFFSFWGFILTAICYLVVLVGRQKTPLNNAIAFAFSFLIPLTINYLDPTKILAGPNTSIFYGESLIPISYSAIIYVCFLL